MANATLIPLRVLPSLKSSTSNSPIDDINDESESFSHYSYPYCYPTRRRPFHWTSKRLLVLLSAATYLTALFLVRRYSSTQDPTSIFFRRARGYEPRYSKVRAAQAEAFIGATLEADSAYGSFKILQHKNNPAQPSSDETEKIPKLCVTVPTVARPDGQVYVRGTIGSLLEGLMADERRRLHLILFVAHTEPETHPVWGERWTGLVDKVMTYSTRAYEGTEGSAGRGWHWKDYMPGHHVTDEPSIFKNVTRAEIHAWEELGAYKPKGLFDYALALHACAATGAPHVAVLEDDVLAARGWYAQALRAVRTIKVSEPFQPNATSPAWLYLRLFYTETFLGWNAEFWPTYLFASLALFLCTLFSLIRLRRLCLLSLTPRAILSITCIFLPLCIALFLAAGRCTVLPLREGVHRMDDFGCCGQAMLFPRAHVPLLVEELRANWETASQAGLAAAPSSVPGPSTPGGHGDPTATADAVPRAGYIAYADMLLEHIAGTRRLGRYAVSPSSMQHQGLTSSRGDDVADRRARMIWSWSFESLDLENGVRGGKW